MRFSLCLTVFFLCTIALTSGCSRSNDKNDEVAKAEAARAAAARARAEADAAKAALPKPPKTPTSPRVWRDTEADEFCKWLGIEADCFRFEGGWITFWLEETDTAGKQSTWGEDQMKLARVGAEQSLAGTPEGKASGLFVWVRRSQNKYDWDLAFKSKVKSSGGVLGKLLEKADPAAKGAKVERGAWDSSSGRITLAPPDGKKPLTPTGKSRLIRGDAEVALSEERVMTLVTLQTVGEKEEVVRTVKLRCKALK